MQKNYQNQKMFKNVNMAPSLALAISWEEDTLPTLKVCYVLNSSDRGGGGEVSLGQTVTDRLAHKGDRKKNILSLEGSEKAVDEKKPSLTCSLSQQTLLCSLSKGHSYNNQLFTETRTIKGPQEPKRFLLFNFRLRCSGANFMNTYF